VSSEQPSEDGIDVEVLDAEALLGALVDHDVAFVVIGGLSLAAHGFVRATKDLDIVPDPDPANLSRLAHALRDLRAEVLVAADFDPRELGIQPDEDGLALGGNWVLRTRFGRLDVMQDVPGIRGYAQLAAGAVAFTLHGTGPLRFAGRDEVVAMKTAAGRPQDLVDLQRLEALRASGG
jgi:hypothetical protein